MTHTSPLPILKQHNKRERKGSNRKQRFQKEKIKFKKDLETAESLKKIKTECTEKIQKVVKIFTGSNKTLSYNVKTS